jgi:NDP-sugar pyrophosphorylase family protein
MQGLILAGGKGTRLRPLTVNTPKPIVPICNKAFLLYQIEMLRRAGITNIALCLSYQPSKIEQLLGDGSEYGVHLRYTVEPQPMGTAGAYKFAAGLITEPTVVFNGDILTDIDLKAVIREHQERKADATVVLQPVEDPRAYGLVETEADGRVRCFKEKPKTEAEITTNNINAGTYVLEPHILNYIPDGETYSFEYQLFPSLLERGERFFAHIPKRCYWMDIGTPERYLQAHHDLLAGDVPRIHINDKLAGGDISPAAQIDDLSLIGLGSTIKAGATIINSAIGPGCYIEEKAHIENSVIWGHTRVSVSACLNGVIIGRGCHIGRAANLRPGTILGDKSALTDFTLT